MAEPAVRGGFNPRRTRASDEQRAVFIQAIISGNLEQVPGIGGVTVTALGRGDDRVTNTFQLIGKFLSFKPDAISGQTDIVEHCDNFYDWLVSKNADRPHDIVQSIAEKVDCSYPGMYNDALWE